MSGKLLGIPCRSKAWALVLYRLMIEWGVEKDRILLFTKHSKQSEIDHFKNIEQVIKDNNIQIVIFSPIIKTGADISIPFNKIYAFAPSLASCSYRDFMQMLGRFRELLESLIRLVVLGKPGQMNVTPSVIKSKIEQREQCRQKYFRKLVKHKLVVDYLFDEASGEMKPVSTNNDFMEQYILNEMEQYADFDKEFLELCKKKGYTMEKMEHWDGVSDYLDAVVRIKEVLRQELMTDKQSAAFELKKNPHVAELSKNLIKAGKDVDEIDALTIPMQPMAEIIDLRKFDPMFDWKILSKNKHVFQRLKMMTDAKDNNQNPMDEYLKFALPRDDLNLTH